MLIYIITSLFLIHPYYVSVSESVFNKDESSLQITKKIFFDDLELVLQNENNNENFDILNSEKDSVDKYIESYLYENILFDIDGIKRKINYLGHEHLNGTINCYFEILEVDKFENLFIKDTSLFSDFDSQENLIYFEMDNYLNMK